MDERFKKRKEHPQQNDEISAIDSVKETPENKAIKQFKEDADAARKQEEIKNSTIGGF